MNIKTLILAGAFACALSGCVTVDSIFGEIDPQISDVELQALQTREYDATEDQLFSSVIGAFQSYGFVVQSADRSTGLVIAKTTSEAEINSFSGITRTEFNKATAFIERVAEKRVSIRVSIVKHVSATGAYGAHGEKEAMRTLPNIYQGIFSKIEKSLFLKKNL